MDIMGSGGFLLTNYQEDFLDDFQPGEDLVFYESEDDFLGKITYYLSHDAERRQIAANCLGKMSESHICPPRQRYVECYLKRPPHEADSHFGRAK